MGEEKVLYSVKMRSSLGGAHGVADSIFPERRGL